MSRAEDDGLELISDDDDLIEVQVTRTATRTRGRYRFNPLEDLLNTRPAPPPRAVMNLRLPSPAGGTRPAGHGSAHHSRRPTPSAPQSRSASQGPSRAQTSHQQPHSFRRPASRPPPQEAAVIDLTEEPDSPVQRRRTPQAPQQHREPMINLSGRNPRRSNTFRISPPRLSRSDGTFMAAHTFIDLTADSPEDEERATPHRWHSGRHHHNHNHNDQHVHAGGNVDQLIQLELLHQQNLASAFGRSIANFLNRGFVRGGIPLPQPDFEVAHVMREDSPKPAMEPAPPTREGFTRNTCTEADQEQVVVCPACNEELAYDPTDSSVPQTKKRKRAPGEHHFWALKKCGHVYCAECFENRKPTKASPNGVGFPVPSGRIPANSPNEIRCAVEGCDTKVALKTEWIGIFL